MLASIATLQSYPSFASSLKNPSVSQGTRQFLIQEGKANPDIAKAAALAVNKYDSFYQFLISMESRLAETDKEEHTLFSQYEAFLEANEGKTRLELSAIPQYLQLQQSYIELYRQLLDQVKALGEECSTVKANEAKQEIILVQKHVRSILINEEAKSNRNKDLKIILQISSYDRELQMVNARIAIAARKCSELMETINEDLELLEVFLKLRKFGSDETGIKTGKLNLHDDFRRVLEEYREIINGIRDLF